MYNSDKKEWSGPSLDEMGIDITMPYGEYFLDRLKKHGDKLIQVFELYKTCKLSN